MMHVIMILGHRIHDKVRGELKRPVFVVFDYERGRGGGGGGWYGGNVKRQQNFFISYAFFGVFQNDPGPPKYALELRGCVKYMFFPPFQCSL